MLEVGKSELRIFGRIFGKRRVDPMDKTVEVIGRGLASYGRPNLTPMAPLRGGVVGVWVEG